MSRRESRVSMNARQTDTLTEFENFKKKFLQANKQITKLNSTMSQRIEELNNQISTLYNENLRLRASEISLATELKRERDKTRKVMEEVESAALGLTKHFGFLRQTLDIPHSRGSPSPASSPPRATRKPSSSPPSPSSMPTRLSREPTVPGIDEEDEPESPRREKKSKSKPRLSASKLPLPSRTMSPPPLVDLSKVPPSSTHSRKKPSRRQSGLFPQSIPLVDEVAHSAPVTPPPEDEDDDVQVVDCFQSEPEVEERPLKQEKRRRKERQEGDPLPPKKTKFKDLTNEPRRASPPLVDPPRQFLTPSPPRDALPTPQPSLSPEPAGTARRVRKSVNYAEPKLNTKMRRPDGVPPLRKQRMSASATDDRQVPLKRTKSTGLSDDEDEDEDGDENGEEAAIRRRRKAWDKDRDREDSEGGEEADADEEYQPSSYRGFVNVARRKAVGGGERRHSLAV